MVKLFLYFSTFGNLEGNGCRLDSKGPLTNHIVKEKHISSLNLCP